MFFETTMLATRFNLDPTVGNTRRPSFKIGTQLKMQKPAIRDFLPRPISTKRDDRFMRPAFTKSSPVPRGLKSIAEIERLKVKQEGIKVRLGDASLGKIKVKKRDRLGNVILDATGQPVFEEVVLNFGLLAQMLEGSFRENMERLEELATAIRTGTTKSQADRDAFTVAFAQIIGKQENVARLTATQLDFITRSLQLLGIARDPVAAGLQDLVRGRFVTNDTWERRDGRNKGPIILFLIANVRDNPRLSPNRPIFGKPNRFSGEVQPIQLISIFTLMSGSSRKDPAVIDLIDKTIHNTLREAIARASLAPVGTAPFTTAVSLPVDPLGAHRVSGVSIEEEDEKGVFRVVGALDPRDLAALPRLEGESTIARLARESAQRELDAQRGLVPFTPQVIPTLPIQQQRQPLQFEQAAAMSPEGMREALRLVFESKTPEVPPRPGPVQRPRRPTGPAKRKAQEAQEESDRKIAEAREERITKRALNQGISFDVASRRDIGLSDFDQDDTNFGMIIPRGAKRPPKNIQQLKPTQTVTQPDTVDPAFKIR